MATNGFRGKFLASQARHATSQHSGTPVTIIPQQIQTRNQSNLIPN
ncbi:hypothetical protein [Bathymodiolus japonicus methanotrophic gill symbiont]|nr:hypothetical protein [Bathymodiolus japonicus methanotrophic gill symbiont]